MDQLPNDLADVLGRRRRGAHRAPRPSAASPPTNARSEVQPAVTRSFGGRARLSRVVSVMSPPCLPLELNGAPPPAARELDERRVLLPVGADGGSATAAGAVVGSRGMRLPTPF